MALPGVFERYVQYYLAAAELRTLARSALFLRRPLAGGSNRRRALPRLVSPINSIRIATKAAWLC